MSFIEEIRAFREEYERQIFNLTEELRHRKLPVLTEALFQEFETCGNRIRYEKEYFGRRMFLSVYALAAVIRRKAEDIVKLEEILLDICQEECWALPAHVNRMENPDWRNTIDLFASETAQSLVHICTLLEDVLSESVKLQARQEARRRVLDPFMQAKKPYEWESLRNNWNAVCCGNVGSLGLLLLEEGEEKQQLIRRICHALETDYLGSFGSDGVCQEGLGYWAYGVTYYMLFADGLKACNHSVDLIHHPKMEAIAHFQEKCYFSGGKTISFSDGDGEGRYPVGLTAMLHCYYSGIRFPQLAYAQKLGEDSCWRWVGIYWNWYWSGQLIEQLENNQLAAPEGLQDTGITFLGEAQWAVLRGEHHSAAVVKGGNNGESHNHNDVGSFYYLADGEVFLDDLGAGEYTKEYFSPKRYTIFCNNGESHNIPMIQGNAQIDGEQYQADRFEQTAEGIEISFAGAYPEGLAEQVVRCVCLKEDSGDLYVTDQIKVGKGCSAAENMITRLPVTVENGAAIIHGIKRDAVLTVTPAAGDPKVTVVEHSNHSGQMEQIQVIRWDVTEIVNQGNPVRIHLQLKAVSEA